MTFRPLHDRILVRRIEADEKTAGSKARSSPSVPVPVTKAAGWSGST
jgi:hypothetical protein